MISVDAALAAVLQRVSPRAPQRVPFRESVGLVLAADVLSDIDSPPHDKAMVDGYAVIAADVERPPADLVVLEEVAAGAVPSHTIRSGCATRIMTGAPVPPGADAVVMVEHTQTVEPLDGEPVVRVSAANLIVGANIMPRGTSIRRGERVLAAGRVIRAIDLGVMGEVGAAVATVHPRPSVAVLATGNELVPVDTLPGPGQIRNSNGPMLAAQVARAGGQAVELGVAEDNRDELSRLIQRGLAEDVLLLSGGVSAGVYDLVPSVLASLRVEQVFHKVSLRPGKPLWFGTMPDGDRNKLVFGLPGNPVSSLVCFELFVRPALAGLSGRDPHVLSRGAELSCSHQTHGDRPTYYPARTIHGDRALQVEPLNWKGSADLRTLADADCLIGFPAGSRQYNAGDQVDVLML